MHRGTALVLAAVAALAACSKEKKSGPVVADGGGIQVTADEFKAKLDEQSPFIRARYSTLERKKEFLENLIRFELLAKEAQSRGLDKDPEVQATLKKIMVQKLVRTAFDESDAVKPVDDEARKYYQDHQEEFVKPERLRVSAIVIDAPAGSPQRAARSADARKAYARLKAEEQKNPLAFGNVARDVSTDAATKGAGGDLGYRTQEELGQQYGKEVAAAAFALKDPGQESGIVETPRGFFILKLGARQPALNRSFDEVKAQLAARVGREKRTRAFDEYVKTLRDKSGVKIHDAELEKIAVAGPPPAVPMVPGATGASPAPLPPPTPGAPPAPPGR